MGTTPESVRFGTDGWRAVIAREFTFDNVSRVAHAIANFLSSSERCQDPIYTEWGTPCVDPSKGVLIGYDTRFLSESFAVHCAAVLRHLGVPVAVSDRFVPTPAVSRAVVDRGAAMGISVTSSHNPPEYSGLKIKVEFGGSAPKSITDGIERHLPEDPGAHDRVHVDRANLIEPYETRLADLVDWDRLTASPVHVVIDSMYGASQGITAKLLASRGVDHAEVRASLDPSFGGQAPEPLERNLEPLREAVRSRKAAGVRTLGVATDGDGDRIAAMDEEGTYIDAHRVYALVLRHLVEARGWSGPVVVTFSVSDLIRRMAEAYGLEVIETPIGFKYATEHLVRGGALMAGEESGGLAVRGDLPERDGVLLSLLLAELLGSSSLPVSKLVATLHERFGAQAYDRRDLEIEAPQRIVRQLGKAPPNALAGQAVRAVETLDGVKLRFRDGWLLFRASGTEPVLRTYCEMRTAREVDTVLATAADYVRSG